MDLEQARKEIDSLDKKILKLVAKRFSLLPELAKFKAENILPIRQLEREKELLSARKALAKSLGLDELFSERLFILILEESLRLQEKAQAKE